MYFTKKSFSQKIESTVNFDRPVYTLTCTNYKAQRMVKPLLCMLSVARLPLRAFICNVALQSGINFVQTDLKGVHTFSKSSSRLTATYMTSCGSHGGSMNSSVKLVDNRLDEPSTLAKLINIKKTVGLCDFDCNILHKDLFLDKDRYITSAMEVGIKYFIVPGSSITESQSILTAAMAETRIRLIGTAGVHPYSAVKDDHSIGNLALLETLVAAGECYAVGECGLDYSSGFPEKQSQIDWFRYVEPNHLIYGV